MAKRLNKRQKAEIAEALLNVWNAPKKKVDRSEARFQKALTNRELDSTPNRDRYKKKHYESWSFASQRFGYQGKGLPIKE